MRRLSVCFWLAVGPLLAAEHPDFSGTWRLSNEESDFAGRAAPENKTEKLLQKDAVVTADVHQTVKGTSRTGTFTYRTDGQPTSNDALDERSTSTAKWDGQDLVVHTAPGGTEKGAAYDDRWSLSLDGSILTVRRHYDGQGIRDDQMLVYHKEPGKTE